jgi:hypothetical protein
MFNTLIYMYTQLHLYTVWKETAIQNERKNANDNMLLCLKVLNMSYNYTSVFSNIEFQVYNLICVFWTFRNLL